jgi:hypothetical protein
VPEDGGAIEYAEVSVRSHEKGEAKLLKIPLIREGDILLYYKGGAWSAPLIDLGEILEDGWQKREYYHCAVALDAQQKIETDGYPVKVDNIQYDGSFDLFRPPIPAQDIRRGLDATRQLIGQKYDWLLIVDDALRFTSRGIIHLPRRWIESEERRRKICSSLVVYYLRAAGWHGVRRWPPATPEDLFLALKDYQVYES